MHGQLVTQSQGVGLGCGRSCRSWFLISASFSCCVQSTRRLAASSDTVLACGLTEDTLTLFWSAEIPHEALHLAAFESDPEPTKAELPVCPSWLLEPPDPKRLMSMSSAKLSLLLDLGTSIGRQLGRPALLPNQRPPPRSCPLVVVTDLQSREPQQVKEGPLLAKSVKLHRPSRRQVLSLVPSNSEGVDFLPLPFGGGAGLCTMGCFRAPFAFH